MWKFITNLLGLKSSPSTQSHPTTHTPSASHSGTAATRTARLSSGPAKREDRRTFYIRTQALQLAERFSKDGGEGILLDEAEFNWLIIPKYPMPERWRQRWTKLMILFPAGYPDTPPTGFYLTIRGRLKSGAHDRHLFKGGGFYADAPDLSKDGWFWYCVHAEMQGTGGWKPSADPQVPDNLFTFLNMCREALTTDE